MMNHRKQGLFSLTIMSMIAASLACSQPLQAKLPHRVITATDIQKAGDQQFQYVLHYLLPDVFPRTDQAWERTSKRMTIYVDNKKFEPEYINRLRPGDVTRILIWETRWEPSPMSLPTLSGTKYVVSIETIRLKQSG